MLQLFNYHKKKRYVVVGKQSANIGRVSDGYVVSQQLSGCQVALLLPI